MIQRHRTAIALLLAAGLIFAVGAIRSSGQADPHLAETFLAKKLLWHRQFDVVVAGDSRVYRGVCPSVMKPLLLAQRIANFGFSGCGLTAPYLKALEQLLDPQASQPVIILGVTAQSLSPVAARENEFLELHRLSRLELLEMATIGHLAHFCRPFEEQDIRGLLGKQPAEYSATWHPDGWVASRKIPEDPLEAVRKYRERVSKAMVKRQVSDEIVDQLLDTVRQWRERGILVYGFRPPTPKQMVELENTLMGFDEPTFVQQFEDAGGLWLTVGGNERYHSYDGSHLREDAAIAFSRDLALVIQQAN